MCETTEMQSLECKGSEPVSVRPRAIRELDPALNPKG